MSTWRSAQAWDQRAIESFLEAREPDSLPISDRLFHQEGSALLKRMRSVALWEQDGQIAGLIFHQNRGLCLPVFHSPDQVRQAAAATDRPALNPFALAGLSSDVQPFCHCWANPHIVWQYHSMALPPPPHQAVSAPSFGPACTDRWLGLEFRPAAETDLESLLELEEAYQIEEVLIPGSRFNTAAARQLLQRQVQQRRILGVFHGSLLIAKATISAWGKRSLQVGGVHTRQEWRGHGLATRLMNLFVQAMLSQGWGLSLFVRQENQAAIHVYRHCGFLNRAPYCIAYYQEPS